MPEKWEINEVSLPSVPAHCLESFQVMVQGEGIQAKPMDYLSWGERAESMEVKCLEFPGQNTAEEINTKRTLKIFRGSSSSIHLSSGWPYLRANYPGVGKEPPEKSRSNDTCHIRRLEIVPVPKSKTRKLQNWWGFGWVQNSLTSGVGNN